MEATRTFPALHFLNNGHGLKSWLLTKDHKRIAILYLITVSVFFFIGGLMAVGVRLELVTPAGDFVAADTYNKMFTLHGVIMVFFFLIPSIPAVARQLPDPDHDRRQGRRVSADQSAELLHLRRSAASFVLSCDRHGRRRHRLDVLHAVQRHGVEHQRRADGARRLHHRLLVDSDRPELHRHDPPHARARDDLVPAAAVHLGALRGRA